MLTMMKVAAAIDPGWKSYIR